MNEPVACIYNILVFVLVIPVADADQKVHRPKSKPGFVKMSVVSECSKQFV